MRAICVAGMLVGVAAFGQRGYAEVGDRWPVLPAHYQGCYYILVDPRLYPRERLPHFALYPPVYYSLPVARPYGHSPFAYPPGYLTPKPEPVSARPVTILNPYVPGKAGETPSPPAGHTAAKPVRIYNRFVSQSGAAPIAKSTAPGR